MPADIGLAQVIFESGLSGTRRSNANAVGFCQWQRQNWKRLSYFSAIPIQERNQTTQAPYCAAYLSVLATKYGSFIPALSEHNAGGTNVGRMLITGEHLGAARTSAPDTCWARSSPATCERCRAGTTKRCTAAMAVRSYLYAEMVFGNTSNVSRADRVDATAADPGDAHAARDSRSPRSSSGRVWRRTKCAASIRRSSIVSRLAPRSTFRPTSASSAPTSRSGAGRPALPTVPCSMISCASSLAPNDGTIQPSPPCWWTSSAVSEKRTPKKAW